jgi:hypothetical protein
MVLSSPLSRSGRPGVSAAQRVIRIALGCLAAAMLTGAASAYAVPPGEDVSAPAGGESLTPTHLAQAQPSPAAPPSPAPPPPPTSNAPAASAPAPAGEPIGNVATLTGTATLIRNKDSIPLKLKDDIYLNDVLVTSANSTLGVTFNDATTFNLTANARITVDNYVYQDGSKSNSALFDITKGTVAFVAAAVARDGDMKITTPSASLGIRGTTGLVEVQPGATATSANNIKLYPDADGKVGHIDVNDRSGMRLGSLTQGSSGFTVRPGAGGRVTATPLVISPQEAARDRGIVRQVHATQVVGRQVVTEQRALRQANPNRSNAPGRVGPQRQNNLQQRPGPNQPGSPNRAGQPAKPGQPGQPATPSKPGQPGQQPPSPNRSGQQGQQPGNPPAQQGQQAPGAREPNATGVRQGASPNRPAALPKRPAAPKTKPAKQKKR